MLGCLLVFTEFYTLPFEADFGYAVHMDGGMLRPQLFWQCSVTPCSSCPKHSPRGQWALGSQCLCRFSAPEQAVFYLLKSVKSAKLDMCDMFILQRGSVLSGQRRCRILAAMVAWRQKGIESKGWMKQSIAGAWQSHRSRCCC